eukprot:7381023-Prymnesium_polylepis.1
MALMPGFLQLVLYYVRSPIRGVRYGFNPRNFLDIYVPAGADPAAAASKKARARPQSHPNSQRRDPDPKTARTGTSPKPLHGHAFAIRGRRTQRQTARSHSAPPQALPVSAASHPLESAAPRLARTVFAGSCLHLLLGRRMDHRQQGVGRAARPDALRARRARRVPRLPQLPRRPRG